MSLCHTWGGYALLGKDQGHINSIPSWRHPVEKADYTCLHPGKLLITAGGGLFVQHLDPATQDASTNDLKTVKPNEQQSRSILCSFSFVYKRPRQSARNVTWSLEACDLHIAGADSVSQQAAQGYQPHPSLPSDFYSAGNPARLFFDDDSFQPRLAGQNGAECRGSGRYRDRHHRCHPTLLRRR